MSVHVMSWVLKHSDEEVAGRRLVLLVLADKADDDGTKAYPSVQTIAREARMSERGVRYALRALEESGRIQRVGVNTRAGTYEYRVLLGAQIAPPGGNTQQAGGQNTTDYVSQIAPEPSFNHPEETTPPDPPASGGEELDSSIAPLRPKGHSKRKGDEYSLAIAAWTDEHFPGADPDAVSGAVGWIRRADHPVVTADDVRELCASNPLWATQLNQEAA